jgi:pyridoxamine 5'-phosphate oxidase family protein
LAIEYEDAGAFEKDKTSHVSFSESEAEYLAENILGRLATVSRAQAPHVVPVVYRFDGSNIYFSGLNLVRSQKYVNIMRNNKVAFVVDDLVSIRPWKARGIEIRGYAEPYRTGDDPVLRIVPTKKASWGLEE